MRTIRTLTAATCLVLVIGLATTAAAAHHAAPALRVGARLTSHPVKTGLNGVAGFTFAPGGTIWYLDRGTGQVHVLNPKNGKDHLFFTITNVDGSGERGALGIALHPRWPKVPFVYIYVTRNLHGTTRNYLIRLRAVHGHGRGLTVLLSQPVGPLYHNGGHILFGPDRKLYVMIGDAHDSANAQILNGTNLRGKIMRLNADGTAAKGNPHGRVWSFGHRNSFGFTFDPKTGRLWETENGPECNDEINLIVRGANFGWGPSENCSGTSPQDTNNSGPTPRILPKYTFDTTIGITGAAFCINCGIPSLNGDLVFGDVNTASLRYLSMNATRTGFTGTDHVIMSGLDGVYSVETSPTGRIYYSGQNGIYRLGP
ncbi:MAG TPA: PQQ-dependent sugar dehydrogenase [Actinomycetota bacterium]|nr:PQQ-dependent sugar dehydrogenase [Actinomycetota bacterium]